MSGDSPALALPACHRDSGQSLNKSMHSGSCDELKGAGLGKAVGKHLKSCEPGSGGQPAAGMLD